MIQKFTGDCVAKALEDKFATKVNVGTVNLGFLNRIIVDDFEMYDKEGKDMLHASRLSVSINIIKLLDGKISISSAQVFGLKANLYKKNAITKPNYQFLIDSLASKDTTSTPLDLHISSFVIRHGTVRYDRLDIPGTPSKLNLNHILISDLNSDIRIRHITDNSLDAEIKRLAFNEQSGLSLANLKLKARIDRKHAEIRNLYVELPHSTIKSDSITAHYRIKENNIDINTLSAAGYIDSERFTLSDISFISPIIKNLPITMGMRAECLFENGKLYLQKIKMQSADNSIRLLASGYATPLNGMKKWNVRLNDLYIGQRMLDNTRKLLTALKVTMPKETSGINVIRIKGYAAADNGKLNAVTELTTNLGTVKAKASKNGTKFYANVESDRFKLGELLADKKFGTVSVNMTSNGVFANNKLRSIYAKGNIPVFDYNGYSYRNIGFNTAYNGKSANGSISIHDPNINMDIKGEVSDFNKNLSTRTNADIKKFCPKNLNISSKWGNADFSTRIYANTTGKDIKDMKGEITLSNFRFTSATQDYSINSLYAKVAPRQLLVKSDFGEVEINGRYNLATIDQSIFGLLKKKLPTLPGLSDKLYASDNSFSVKAEITDTKWLEILGGIPLHANMPININADIDDVHRAVNAMVTMPDISYNGEKFKNIRLGIRTVNDTLFADARLKKLMNNKEALALDIKANAADNRLNSNINIDYDTSTRIKGNINTSTRFYSDSKGRNNVMVEFMPSEFTLKDSVWNVRPSKVLYNSNRIWFDNFAIEHGKQHIIIDGVATHNINDSICVDLHDVDVNYILDLVNFHSVEFSGKATGKAYLKSVLNSPEAYAKLTVDDFKFQQGRMGVLHAGVNWNKTDKQIDIDAVAQDENNVKTIIKGYVSPERNYIDLGITAEDTNIEFLKSFCGSFMSDVKAKANGFAQVYGDLSAVNLRGNLVADGTIKISTLNTVYRLKNDTIRMEPNEIIFDGDTVRDRSGNIAIVRGALHHKNLTRLTYDLNIEARKFLCYDFKSYGDNSFYGTVIGTGDCSIIGRPHNITFNIDMTPNKGSFIEYNAANPDAITNREFISWVKNDSTDMQASTPIKDINEASDMHLNFNINATPDFTLRVLMDKASGDKIALNGSGNIKASWFNKGSFDMFGTYLIDHGSYNLTIQNIIKKDFQFRQGSSIVFGGNPFNALLNLSAVYPVNGVPLAELKIGNSFSSSNVRVDCIMNIGGTPENIKVDFDFDMPTVNNDAKQMVRSLINSEEELNQQVVYLLAIGRFLINNKNNSTQEDAQQSQTSLAMQSLLSGTISQQVNSLLSSVIKNNNWNFGTNISTGTEGFNNAEYEGVLTGNLFSNRLIINGQFGYRDNPNTTSSFIGDFDIKYLLTPSGSIAIKVYNQTNDRYFTKSSINTQGLGLILKRDFGNWKEMFGWKKKDKKTRVKKAKRTK